MDLGVVDSSHVSSSLSSRRRRGSQAATHQPDRLSRRDIQFMHQTVSVVKKIGEFGTSYIYSAKDNLQGKSSRSLLIKAAAAGTAEEARRAEEEVRLFRKLSEAPGILKMIDCGFSTIDERIFDYGRSGTGCDVTKLDVRRLYCTLFEPCPDYFLSDFIKKRRRKYNKRRSRNLFARRKKDEVWEGYLPQSVVLDIFGQMAAAVAALHEFVEENDSPKGENHESTPRPKKGIVHLDIQPSRFLIMKLKEKVEDENRYEVNLCSFGCSVRGGARLTSSVDRNDAAKLIESVTSPIFRSPEMINLHMTEELNGSADIWSLGCCFYSLLFLTDCFMKHNKFDLMRGAFLIPAMHPFESKVIDVLARMLTVDAKQRATIVEVLACLKSLKEGTPLLQRKKAMNVTELETDRETEQMPNTRGYSGHSNNQDHETTDESPDVINRTPGGTAFHVEMSVDTDGATEAEATESRQGGSLSEAWEAPPEEVSSDGTEFSQWLEFQPETPDGSNLQHRSEPVSMNGPTTIIQRKGLRRRRRRQDPLNLGSADNSHDTNRKQPMFADWTLGLITQLSTRSLNPIGTESDGDIVTRDIGISPLREPSLRNINPYGHQSKTPKHPGLRHHLYGSRYNMSSQLPSLRITDLMKDGIPCELSKSSSEVQSSASNDIAGGSIGLKSSTTYASSDFYSSTEMPSSSEIGESATSFTLLQSDMSASLPRTPLSASTRKALSSIVESEMRRKGDASIDDLNVETPTSNPAMLLSIVSPNREPNIPFNSQKNTISPRNFNESLESPAFRRPPSALVPEASQISESQVAPKTRRSKSKKSKKKKSRKKRKSREKEHNDATYSQQEEITLTIDEHVEAYFRQPKSDPGGAGLRASVNSNFSAPEFDLDGKDTDSDGGQILEAPSFNRRDTWGNYSSPGDWAVNPDELREEKKILKSAMKKNKSLPARSFKIDSTEVDKEKKLAASASDLDAWDLKEVEQWVTTKSQEALHKAKISETKPKDPYHMKGVACPSETDVPKDWVKDARLWVKSNSTPKVAHLGEEMQSKLSTCSKAPSEVDASWFASPAAKVQTTDAAGFPLPPMSLEKPGNDVELRNSDEAPKALRLKQLDRYLTPKNKREKMIFPRSALSVNDLSNAESKGTASLSHQTVGSSRRKVRRSGRGIKMLRSTSGFSQHTTHTRTTNLSVDSNLPPGDEIVEAEVSVPTTTVEERTRHSISVKDEVHMALTEEGRHMRHSIKKIETELPYVVLSKMLLQEKEPEKVQPRSRSRPSSPKRKSLEQESVHKSTGAMNVTTMIELFTTKNQSFPRAAVASSNTLNARHQFQTGTPKRSAITQKAIPSFTSTLSAMASPIIAAQVQSSGQKPPRPTLLPTPTTPRRSKKKKKSKSHRKDREGVRKSKSERVNRLEDSETPRATLGRSLTQLGEQSDTFGIDLVAAEWEAKATRKNKTRKNKCFSHRTEGHPGGLSDLVAKVGREILKAKSERIKSSSYPSPVVLRTLHRSFPVVTHVSPSAHLPMSPILPLELSPAITSNRIRRKFFSKKTELERNIVAPERAARVSQSP